MGLDNRLSNTALFALAALPGLAALCAGAPAIGAEPPRRVVSMNLCTDQLAMLIADPGQLVSVSYLAQRPDASTMAEAAAAYPANHGQAEEIFLLEPDLVLSGVFTSRATTALLKRLGYRVEEFEPAYSFAEVRANIRRMGSVLGRERRADALVAEFDARLDEARGGPDERRPRLALYYANSYTSGAGTLADEVVDAAGFDNIAREFGVSGTLKLPLEALVMASPDVVVGKRAEGRTPGRAYENYQHPALRLAARRALMASVADKYWICGGPFTAEAVRILGAARSSEKREP